MVFFGSQELLSDNITVVAEESFPIHYLNDGQPVGLGNDLIRAVLERSNIEYEINIYPWARAYQMAKSVPNVLISPIARTKEREKLFKWVGEVTPLNYALIKLKSRTDISVKNFQDARKFDIGVIRDDVVHLYLKQNNFKSLNSVNRLEQNIKMLAAGRIDLIPSNLTFLSFKCAEMKIDCNLFQPVLKLDEISNGLYMAFSLQTDDLIVSKAIKTYQELKANGQYDKIMDPGRYIPIK